MSFLNGTDPGLRQTRTPTTQEFTGSGQSSVTLSNDPGSEDNVIITFDGVVQHRSTYSVSGTTLSFSSAVPTGVAKIEATFTITHPVTEPADNSVTLAKLADGTQGQVLYYGASGAPTLLTAGTSGHFLKTQGAGANPAWAAAGGKVVQVVTANTTAVATGTTAFPTDDTIPQNSEGVEIETLAITPTNASNLLYFWFNSAISHTANGTVVIALFQDSTANALAATEAVLTATNGGQCSFHHQMTAGTTSATTFKIRIGGQTASTLTVNGGGGSRRYGGTSTCRLTIMEVSA